MFKQESWLCFPGAPQQLCFFSQARVALALVLLKTRPSGVSAPQYAQNLVSRLKSLNEGWKVEARELQREVLRLRQELLLSRAAARASSSECPPGCPGGCQGFTRSQQKNSPKVKTIPT